MSPPTCETQSVQARDGGLTHARHVAIRQKTSPANVHLEDIDQPPGLGMRLLDAASDLRAFLEENKGRLKLKG